VQGVHREVHERHAPWAGVVEPVQPQHRALDRDGRVPLDELEDLRGDPVGERAATRDVAAVEVEVRDVASVGEQHRANGLGRCARKGKVPAGH
jgi:hypothetical protein